MLKKTISIILIIMCFLPFFCIVNANAETRMLPDGQKAKQTINIDSINFIYNKEKNFYIPQNYTDYFIVSGNKNYTSTPYALIFYSLPETTESGQIQFYNNYYAFELMLTLLFETEENMYNFIQDKTKTTLVKDCFKSASYPAGALQVNNPTNDIIYSSSEYTITQEFTNNSPYTKVMNEANWIVIQKNEYNTGLENIEPTTKYIVGDYEYYVPTGYENIAILGQGNSRFLVFTKDTSEIYLYQYYYVKARNKDTQANEEFYYIKLPDSTWWDTFETLTNQEKILNASYNGTSINSEDLYLMGTKTWILGYNSTNTLPNVLQKYYNLERGDYNAPEQHGGENNSDYIVFQRENDEKIYLLFRPKVFTDDKNIGYDKFYFHSDTEYFQLYNSNTYYLMFDTQKEIRDYLFNNKKISEHTKMYLSEETRINNSIDATGGVINNLQNFNANTTIYASTLDVYDKTTGEKVKTSTPYLISEWEGNVEDDTNNDNTDDDNTDDEGILGGILSKIEEILKDIWNGIKTTAENIKEVVISLGKIPDAIEKILKDLFSISNNTFIFNKAGELINEKLEDNSFYTSIMSIRNTLKDIFNEDYSDPNGFYELGLTNIKHDKIIEYYDYEGGSHTVVKEKEPTFKINEGKVLNLDWYFGEDLGHYTKRGLKPYIDNIVSAFLWLMFAWALYKNMPNWISGELTQISNLATTPFRNNDYNDTYEAYKERRSRNEEYNKRYKDEKKGK